ncbi:MAG: LysM peptidoglycan-binding domain-containing protein [Chloroflexi bacterium]|nr:LysM peptidoglycan-binding domain-containing protein [Chloroflexota bacterium]
MRRLIVLLLSLLVLVSLGTAAVAAQQVHIVQRGETLSIIAARYSVNLADLLQANGMTMDSIIHRGNQITIPGAGGSSAPAGPAAPAGNTTYTVQRGDYLSLIAANHRTTFLRLAELNALIEPYILHTGQVLIVPSIGGAAAPGVGPPNGQPSSYSSYTIQPGDSLAEIAAKYGMTYFDLARLNNIDDPDAIKAGQVLQVPGPPAPPPPPAPAPAVEGAPAPPPSPSISGGFELGGQALGFTQPEAMRNARMTWVKRQVRWNGSQGAGDFQSWIDHAHGLGFKILLSVIGDHHQLASNPGQYYQNYANFLAGLARGGADAIEVWNESNIDREWPAGQISGANYTQMLSAAFHAIKGSRGETMVISAAPTPTGYFSGGCTPNGSNDDCYIREMAAAGAANVMDCVGVHWNNGFLPPTATTGGPSGHYSYYLPAITNLYRSVFPGKPLCFTELGYVSPEGYPPLPDQFSWGQGTTVAEQAAWLAGAVNFLRGQNTRLMIVWNVDSTSYVGNDPQSGYAIVRPGGGCPACDTLRAAMGG